jgi:hypothetical protein
MRPTAIDRAGGWAGAGSSEFGIDELRELVTESWRQMAPIEVVEDSMKGETRD